ncbi:MAG: anti-sigma factor [Caldimonas sp.]
MNESRPPDSLPPDSGNIGTSVGEAELHAYADGELPATRREAIEAFLAGHDPARRRVDDWQRQKEGLGALLDPVLAEPLPARLPLQPSSRSLPWRALAAGLVISAASAGAAWTARGFVEASAVRAAAAGTAAAFEPLSGFARRAAVAHAVYTPEVRRPVEVGAEQEQALVTWLTRRIGSPVKAPALGPLGYELIGGRLLPGESGPVAQFMYGATDRPRLTLYITADAPSQEVAFRFGQQGKINVFYWVEGRFGYALSAESGKAELAKVAEEVYRQLKPG